LDHAFSSHILDTIQELFARRGAWALVSGVWTSNMKDIAFRVFYELKKLETHFQFNFDCGVY